MFGKIGKAIGYKRAPRTTFFVRHPVRGFRMWRAARRPINRAAAAGAGAAVLALPLSIWYLKRR